MPDVKILVGGPGATIEPARTISMFSPSHRVALVQGEAEPVFSRLLTAQFSRWHDLGAWTLAHDGTVLPGKRFVLSDLDASPFADLSASEQRCRIAQHVRDERLPLDERLAFARSEFISQIESRRGCYYRCEFCNQSSLPFERVRRSSPERLFKEMDALYTKHGITFFSLTDNVAFDEPDWWMAFADLLERAPFSPYVQFAGYGSPKLLAKDAWLTKAAPRLSAVGLRSIILGVQAGSRRILREIIPRPADDPENALACVRALVPLGINVKLDFILGHPTETIDDLEETRRVIAALRSAGGEVFVRRLGVVPHSGYAHALASGTYALPERTRSFVELEERLLAQKARDDEYRAIAFANGIPTKYVIDRSLGLLAPSPQFSVQELQKSYCLLERSQMPGLLKERYARMYELAIRIRENGP